jgi:hypothetical protein
VLAVVRPNLGELRRNNVGVFLYRLSHLREQLHKEMTVKQPRHIKELFDAVRWRLRWHFLILLDRLKLREMVFYKTGIDVSVPDHGDRDPS